MVPCWSSVVVFLLWTLCVVPCWSGSVQFIDTQVLVEEGNQFDLKLLHNGEITSIVNVIVSLNNSINQDFVGSSQIAYFSPGGSIQTAVTFTVQDDNEPELEETFYFILSVIGTGTTVTVPNMAAVTIMANDDAYGVFSFIDTSPITVREDAVATTIATINIGRRLGTFGEVVVDFSVVSKDPNALVGQDISPPSGSVTFRSGETINQIQLQIRADIIPENDEEFHIVLTSATRGARVESDNFVLVIKANDAPIHFTQQEYRFDENPISRILSLNVTRGLDTDGETLIGAVDRLASVNYLLLPNTAIAGQDYRGQDGQSSGQLAFPVGSRYASINIEIIDDNEPEVEEHFQVLLVSPQGDVVVIAPERADVIINANDNPYGVLSLKSPDLVSLPLAQVNEDLDSDAVFTVVRGGGSFGVVSVKFDVIRNDINNGAVTEDLAPINGTVTFGSGEIEKRILIGVLPDVRPEPAERFLLRLLPATATGGVEVDGIISGVIIVEDSDNYYGSIEFAEMAGQKLVINADPRMLQLNLTRSGANQGDLQINMTISYEPTDGESADVLDDTVVSSIMFSGTSTLIEHIHLLPSAFIQVGGVFVAEITGVQLATAPDIGAFNSPVLGPRSTVSITVTTAEANGEIGFHSIEPVTTMEPDTSPVQVELKLSREGTSGEATIAWSMMGSGSQASMVTAEDVGEMQGTVIMQSGMSETSIFITIMPDDIPELDEELSVTLTSVQPDLIQRLRVGATTRTLVIMQNDNPGGVFQFAESDELSIDLMEGGSPIQFTVIREDGDLLAQSIQYIIEGGEADFYGATNVLRFPPGVRNKQFSVAARQDGVPEMEETFVLRLQSYGNVSAVIGQRSNVQLRVVKNDYPHGLLEFAEPVIYLNESREGVTAVATVMVQRSGGQFGSVQASWSLLPDDETDLRPSSGTVTFNSDQDTAYITLESVADELTEEAESFTLTLSEPTGGAEIGPRVSTSVVIVENDYPIYFTEPDVQVEEPSETVITLRRDGPTTRPVTLRYRTVDSSAQAGSLDFTEIVTGTLVMEVGQSEQSVTVRVLDDSEPEGKETFYLQVYEIVGDVVFSGANQANITIMDNDGAYGVFHFDAPFSQDVEEGGTVRYAISRDGGTFGGVTVKYALFHAGSNVAAINGDDFSLAQNLEERFEKGERTRYISITPRLDDDPELEETYTIKLTAVEVFDGRQDIALARLADFDTSAIVVILHSDDPNGRLGFPLKDQEVSVSEDYNPGMASTSQVSLVVERRMGIYGTIEALWETYSDNVAGGLPKVYDLIFYGNVPSDIPTEPSKRRRGTGTRVLLFYQNTGSFISVYKPYQPLRSEIIGGFSISAWVQPAASTDGYIVAKTNLDGSRHFYTLRIITSSLQTKLVLGYSITGLNENAFQTVEHQRNIEDKEWHHICVTVDKNAVVFYVDNKAVGTSISNGGTENQDSPGGVLVLCFPITDNRISGNHLVTVKWSIQPGQDGLGQAGDNTLGFVVKLLQVGQTLIDMDGSLTVGTIYPGNYRYQGYMQDVRIYVQALTTVEVQELYQIPAGTDLTPISGYIMYPEAINQGFITMTTIQDQEEESDEVFTVKLIGVKGGAVISINDYQSTLTVLKSDNANGLFMFSEQCQPAFPTSEDSSILCTILRERGDDSQVIVTWAVYQLFGSQAVLATSDFVEYTGQVVFEAGERTKTFTVQIKDDNIPESQEVFQIRLVNTTTNDGTVSTNTSGASIDVARSSSMVTLRENDNPNGLLQFSTDLVPPESNDPLIPPATESPTVRVKEEKGYARLLVVRAQGYAGEITVEWRTTDGSAKSSGKSPPDFNAGVGKLTMADGVRYAYINIVIIDNDLPEDEKYFVVTLLNPSGGATLGLGSVVTVVIDHSDGAFGVFQFSDVSLGIQAFEEKDSDFNYAYLQIERVGGSIGQTVISWTVTGDKDNDIVDIAGNLTFSNGQLLADLGLKIRGDTEPELDEVFSVQLVAVSRGELGPSQKLRAQVTVLANDDPYGEFVIPSSNRPLKVDEGNYLASVTIDRMGGTFGAVEVNYTTLSPTESYPYIPSTMPRANLQDYEMTSGSVAFVAGQGSATFVVQLLDDVEPEEDEAFYVRLTGVRVLEQAQIRPVDVSPRLGSSAESYGQVIINYNDNANGELVLSPISPTVYENQTEPFLYVTRFGGTFGEVTVTFSTSDRTAIANMDYVVLSNQVTLARGEKSVAVPIRITDDNLPELQETFAVQLDQVSGGGVLGSVTSTTVTIGVSDDPNGAFEFSVDGVSVEEPEGSPLSVDITVVRRGGAQGIVTVGWRAILNGNTNVDDITPTSGSLFFVSNEASARIIVNVLPDDLPEGQEDIKITIINVTNGARIGARSVFTLAIKSNDNPHGVVQFTNRFYSVEEQPANSAQNIPLTRTGGSFGQLRVYYSTDNIVTITNGINGLPDNVLDYFEPPQFGSLGIEGLTVNIPVGENSTLACARACLSRIACKVFEIGPGENGDLCIAYHTDSENLDIITSLVKHYRKDLIKAGELTGIQAIAGEDYSVVNNGYILIDEGETEGLIPLSIIADSIPEMDEKFIVYLTRVDVTGSPPSPENSPYVGTIRNATITIQANDDTYGAFTVYSDSPIATNDGHLIQVEEKQNLAVDLVVERRGGSIGEVTVDWSVDQTASTAVYGIDYRADGATLTFIPGETRKCINGQRLISVTVLDDSQPELAKSIMVKLGNPRGGSTIRDGNATIVVLENDQVAGIMAFATTSILAREGDTVTLDVTRDPFQYGTVNIDWYIEGLKGEDPVKGFLNYEGSLEFAPGENLKTITLDVLTDNIPEINEEYQIHLTNIKTSGVGVTGAATFDPQLRSASITIEGSNNPHGVIQFGSNSLNVRVDEASGSVTVQLDRKFGAIGNIRVEFEITRGSVSLTNSELVYAEPDADFVSDTSYVDISNDVAFSSINVIIIEDEVPEVDEVFVVRLTSVSLINEQTTANPPVLGSDGIVSQIIINANDGTKGEVIFAADSAVVDVDETSRNITLTVFRDLGTFGDVAVFFYAQSVVEGTDMGFDYKINPQELVFLNGMTTKQIQIEIINDEIPEPDEIFEVILTNPRNGLLLGTPSRAQVTIRANDDAAGFIYFELSDLITLNEPVGDNSDQSIVDIVVMRGPGIYGTVNVPYEIVPELDENRNDLTPMQGTLVFEDRQSSVTLTLSVLDDNVPEDAERFTLNLLDPTGTAKLGTKTQRTIVIGSNDSPNGLFSLFAAGTRLPEIFVEEDIGLVTFDLIRTQGLEGRVTVDVVTEPGTAQTTADVSSVTMAPIQILNTTNVGGWYSFEMNGTVYVLMYKPAVVGEMNSDLGSSGSAGQVDMTNLMYTTLFRWQGVIVPIQTVETDGISGAVSFAIDGSQFLVITNKGVYNRYQTYCRLYTVSNMGTLTVLQNLDCKGATDGSYFVRNGIHYLVITNSADNTGTSNVDSDIWRWEPGTQRFTKVSSLRTLGASAVTVFEIEDKLFMAIANFYDSEAKSNQIDSKIYKFDSNDQFSQHQSIPTLGAVDVEYVKIRSLELLIFANNRDNTVSSPQKSDVYRWDTGSQMFILHERLETSRVENVEVFQAFDDTVYALFANSIGSSSMFGWDIQGNRFKSAWSGPPALSLVPITVSQGTSQIDLVAVADKNITAKTVVHQIIKVVDSDYSPRTITMTMEDNQDLLHASVYILQDTVPEDTETFSVTLRNPTGGAEIGVDNRITVNILSNDNAHGIFEISPDSLNIQTQELVGRDSIVSVNVIRHQGFYGRVTVKWVATGDHDGTNDITPLEGIVEFSEGQSVATVSLTVRDDDIAELQEITYIQLVEVIEKGTSLQGRGARLGDSRTAEITVLANDSPYGVVRWERTSYTAVEPDGTDATLILYVVREQGLTGDLQVTYITSVDNNRPVQEQAVSGEDFISRQAMVVLRENVTRAPVEIVIKQDSVPEPSEVFLVNITRVVLLGISTGPGSQPSVRIPGNVAMITITENDNARGIVQFDVVTNIEGRIDVYEEFGQNITLPLQVRRSVGLFGAVTVTWQVDPREATLFDYSPSDGTVTLGDTQETANIYISVIDDSIPEDMETFEVKLISVTGGALLGPVSSVRIAILKNDSPNGLFRFATAEAVVKESTSPSDPDGEVRLIVERVQGSEGVVNVQWRLNAEAVYDFFEPHNGILIFTQGERSKSLLLRTKPDNILEGQEKFRVSLITADNNADISHTQGDASIIVLPDPGASGTISILPEYRSVYIGEPGESDPSYNGKVQIVLTRGEGIYGDISVTWSITPRDEQAFLQVEGTVNIGDLQQKAAITLQALDDTIPEQRTIYTLQLNSATGGAMLSEISSATICDIVFVASDYSHGEFVFDLPEVYITTEDRFSVSFPVIRRAGLNGQVFVSYKTHPGTAKDHEDYFPEEGTLTFEHGQNQMFIDIQLKQDDEPEGLESFYLNLTSARLVEPSNNNYTVVNGLQLDMRPAIGSLDVKEIMIERNDNAEGTLEFTPEAIDFVVTEDVGIAKIPLTRKGGNFGEVSVTYLVSNATAIEGVDYIVPQGETVFEDGEREAFIEIIIRDDAEMENSEQFKIQLTGATGGALLGASTVAMVTIAKSDYPNGRFGFKGQLEVILDNPPRQIQQMFSVERTGGNLGEQTVYWQIMGPNNPSSPLLVTNDIAYLREGREYTSGSLTWNNGQLGEKTFTLDIKPFSSWEIEKVFIIQLYNVIGSRPEDGNGEVSPTTGKVKLSISKFGHPNGIIRFDGPAKQEQQLQEPDGDSTLTVQFPIIRRPDTGTVGNLKIFWEIQGPIDAVPDLNPVNGSVLIADEERIGDIIITILPDSVPELDEVFQLVITKIEGGAEIDTEFNVAPFRIRYNDNPHGVFGILRENQDVVVDSVDLTRHVKLNFTRHYGTFGRVVLTFSLKYDIPQSGIVLGLHDGTVTFDEGTDVKIVRVGIEGTGFLEMGTTFSVSLIEVAYVGQGVTIPPEFQAGQTEAKVVVPAMAANSKVGFLETMTSVYEETSTSRLTLVRQGMYGTIVVSWQSGFPEGQTTPGFQTGRVVPSSSSISIPHGVESKNFTIQLSPKLDTAELFAVHLPVDPATTVAGGARLLSDKSIVRIEPYGLLRFAANSTQPSVSEMFGKIYLQVIRVYGSEGKVETKYRAESHTASEFDFSTVENHAVVMEPGQTSGLIMIDVLQDNNPEQEEKFFVNLTSVEKFPTDTRPSISPRISYMYGASVVAIEESNDPYGILCMDPVLVEVEEIFQNVTLTVKRTGGIYGTVRVMVRTVGGGEDWTMQIVPKKGDGNNTITEILGNREDYMAARGGTDYVVLNTQVEFKQGETEKHVNVTILSDQSPEAPESVLVYLTQPTGGARIAAGEPDGGKKGYSVIMINKNDLSNGRVGFALGSQAVTVDEDLSPTFTLKLERLDANFGSVYVSWVAKDNVSSSQNQDDRLKSELTQTAGSVRCEANEKFCMLDITLINDDEPEEVDDFVIVLTEVTDDAQLNTNALVATVTVKASDYIRGLIEFVENSEVVIATDRESSVQLRVRRSMGMNYRVEVGYRTLQMNTQQMEYGVMVYPALESEDYDGQTGTLVFQPGQEDLEYIEINLTPFSASNNPYPKQFYVQLRNPTNDASLNPASYQASVLIVSDKDRDIWSIIKDKTTSPPSDEDINRIISQLDTVLQVDTPVTNDEMTLVEDILEDFVDEGQKRKLPTQVIGQLLNLMCKLLTPGKNDATRGRFKLAQVMEKLAYSMVTGTDCPSPEPPQMYSLQCVHAKLSAARWPLGMIQGFNYQAQRKDEFFVPTRIPDAPLMQNSTCADFHMIEFSSEQWFQNSDENLLLSNKVIAFGLKGRPSSYSELPATFKIHSPDRRIATKKAQCVYFDVASRTWVGPQEICEVTNDLDQGVDDFVQCSCKHLTHYAVKATTTDPGLIGYPVWFYVSCFICMTGLALAVLAHHLCSISAMFSASLLMHMCFAAMATQICYVVAAYLSPDEILVYSLDQDNYRCIVMGLFLHYFFLAQFTWMMTQAINFWKILVLNDEHTDRKYVLFFLLGWGLPVVIVAVFYIVVYNLYRFVYEIPQDFIYGDVNNNGDICFITNPYAALGGVILPVLLMLVVVAIVFVKAFQVTPQWQAYDDIYRGRYNISEVRLLLLFWGCIIITWLWGGLHLVYGQFWMLVMFCIFNILQGIMAVILYAILRNPCLIHCFPVKKNTSSYAMNGTSLPHLSQAPSTGGAATGQYQFQPATLDVGSLKGSRASLLNESWERDSLPSRSTMKVRRTLPQGGNLYIDPPVYRQNTISDSKDFDDLLYALKTGGSFTPSEINSIDSDKSSTASSKIDKYELRRIDIADTHL